ncbi:MAG: type II secretion system F family protein [Gemmataceae bacterium]
MQATHLIVALVFAAVAAGVIGLATFTLGGSADQRRTRSRLQDLARGETTKARVGRLLDQEKADDQVLKGLAQGERTSLQARLASAGFTNPRALSRYVTARMALMIIIPLVVGLGSYLLGYLSDQAAAMAALSGGGVAFVAPGLWLEQRIRRRKETLRRALPDALDMLVLCLEGGLSLRGGLQRVTAEIDTVHPLLASEFQVLQSKMQLGLGLGEAFKQFADANDIEDARQLASVLLQSERFGASTAKTLRTYADGFRQERQHVAEEKAQKAAVKILFPTLVCIFPAIFIVILGPAALQIARLFTR